MLNIEEGLKPLGEEAVDKVTGFKGVITSVSFDLYGCIQLLVNPGLDKEGKMGESRWMDFDRMEITSNCPVMAVPQFDYTKGPEYKPTSKVIG